MVSFDKSGNEDEEFLQLAHGLSAAEGFRRPPLAIPRPAVKRASWVPHHNGSLEPKLNLRVPRYCDHLGRLLLDHLVGEAEQRER
jgi:hypothetical protein